MKPVRLVPDWHRAARWWSVRLAALQLALLQGWTMLPDDLKAAVPGPLMAKAASAIALLTIVARVVAQDPPEDKAS